MKKQLLLAILMLLISSAACFAVPVESDASLGIWLSLDQVVGNTYLISITRMNLNGGVGNLSYDINVSEAVNVSAIYTNSWDRNTGSDNSNPAHGQPAQLLDLIRFDSYNSLPTQGYIGMVELLTIEFTDNTTPRWAVFNISNIAATDENGDQITDIWTPGGLAPSLAFEIIPEPATMVMLAIGGLFLRKKA